MDKKNRSYLQIDINKMSNGSPELVKADIQTDIPKEHLIYNKVYIVKVY